MRLRWLWRPIRPDGEWILNPTITLASHAVVRPRDLRTGEVLPNPFEVRNERAYDSYVAVTLDEGRYAVQATGKRGTVETSVDLLVHEETFRDGAPFVMREDVWDNYILHEQPYADLLHQVDPTDVVLDLGAHVGTFTRDALALGAKVYSVEPDPESLEFLRRNVEGRNATVVPGGIFTNHVGVVIGSAAPLSSPTTTKSRLRVDVPTVDLAQFNDVTVVKMDVEGAERWVDWGADWLRHVHTLSLELHSFQHGRDDWPRIRDEIAAAGFTLLRGGSMKGWAAVDTWTR